MNLATSAGARSPARAGATARGRPAAGSTGRRAARGEGVSAFSPRRNAPTPPRQTCRGGVVLGCRAYLPAAAARTASSCIRCRK
jgi:hypothetical protein